ncbi:hypothetical protein ABZ848_29550 [Streptomyces sp. NPDC047081]|uniref:hypothetical protein n=1 Tax=Streptomyces sp. NPDC047081 TaxID=3154706 RepID=UPI0033D5F07B
MRRHTAHFVKPLIPLTLLTGALAVGCGSEQAGSHGSDWDSTRHARARAVADAWEGSKAAQLWAKGYFPLGQVIQLPDGAFHTGTDKEAYATQNFVLDATLPALKEQKGEVKWKDGGSLRLPMMSAREAYDSVARGGNDGPHLTVTGAKLGTTTLFTSRGPATVPAWLFTLKGYDTPLKRVALTAMKQPKAPIAPAAESPSNDLWELGQLVKVSADGRSVTVLAGHGACDDGPVVDVLETDSTVVLSAAVTGAKDGSCTAQLLYEKVTVKLGRALGDRILLDAFTGRPVQPPRWS